MRGTSDKDAERKKRKWKYQEIKQGLKKKISEL